MPAVEKNSGVVIRRCALGPGVPAGTGCPSTSNEPVLDPPVNGAVVVAEALTMPGCSRKSIEHIAIHRALADAVGTQLVRDLQSHDVELRRLEADRRHLVEAAHEQSGRDEQYHGQRDLTRHEHALPASPAATGVTTRSSTASGFGIRSSQCERRGESEQQAGGAGNEQRDGEHSQVDAHVRETGDPRRRRSNDELRADEREHRSTDGADAGEHDTLRQQLTEESPATCAECRARAKLVLATRGFTEKKRGDVDARDEQQQTGSSEQNQ